MKRSTLTLCLLAAALTVEAAQAQEVMDASSFTPGIYGRVELGAGVSPPLLNHKPVQIRPAGSGAHEPLYLYVPRSEVRHWAQHCVRYHACQHPVYFVDGARWAADLGHPVDPDLQADAKSAPLDRDLDQN